MQSNAPNVDAYLEEVQEERREILRALRAACLEELIGFEESMAYGNPAYSRDGVVEVAFASQKRYIALYILRTDVLSAHRHTLTGLDVGKSCIRYGKPAQVDLTVVRALLTDTVHSTGPVC